jgi:hypothetical protein
LVKVLFLKSFLLHLGGVKFPKDKTLENIIEGIIHPPPPPWEYGLTLIVFICVLLVFCPALTTPTKGEDIVLTNNSYYGSTASFKCSTGFHLTGRSTLTCGGDGSSATGSWSGSEPRCIQSKSLVVKTLSILIIIPFWKY